MRSTFYLFAVLSVILSIGCEEQFTMDDAPPVTVDIVEMVDLAKSDIEAADAWKGKKIETVGYISAEPSMKNDQRFFNVYDSDDQFLLEGFRCFNETTDLSDLDLTSGERANVRIVGVLTGWNTFIQTSADISNCSITLE